MNSIYHTGIISLIIQVVTGLFDLYVLLLPMHGEQIFLKTLLGIEFGVQIVEAIFYVWLVTKFNEKASVTQYRYYDWILTTPSMLFTYCMYLVHIADMKIPFSTAFYKNVDVLTQIFGLNTLMLFFGYIAERGIISFKWGAIFGFLPFFWMFYMIYDHFAKVSTIGRITFAYFFGVWALYGVASVMSYTYKNTMYNILDLFAKNFFGVFLAWVLLMKR